MSFLTTIRADAMRYGVGPDLGAMLRLYFRMSGFGYSVWLRAAQRAVVWRGWRRPFRLVVLWRFLHVGRRVGIDTGPLVRIGPGLFIPHVGGIVIHSRAEIGANCYLSHNVTIGKKHSGQRAGVPVIGDDVFIAPGAVVIGGVRIGNGAVVGPNSVVVRDVPAGVTVSGIPAVPLAGASQAETGPDPRP